MSRIIGNLSDYLIDRVREHILSGRVASNEPIRQDAFAAELGVSKIPLREALARLEQEGLLTYRANRGFIVRGLHREEAVEVYALRAQLEPDMMALAATRASDAERAIAIEALARLEEVTQSGREDVGILHRAFHMALLIPSGKPLSVTILQRLQVVSQRYVSKHLESGVRSKRATCEHRNILEAWLARDDGRIRMMALQHLNNVLNDLKIQLDAGGGPSPSGPGI